MITRRIGAALDLRAFSDASWIAAERFASSILGIVALFAVARFLGVESYGHYAFAVSIIGVGLALGHLGLDGLLVKSLIARRDQQQVILGTVCLTKYAIYVPLFAGTFFSGVIVDLGDTGASVLRALSVIFLILPISSTLIAWLNSQAAFRRASLSRITAVVLGTGAKLALIAGGAGIVSVGWAHSALFLMEACLLLLVTWRLGGPMPRAWRFRRSTLIELMREALPLFLASMFAMAYANTDIIALRLLAGTEVVGEYALVQQLLQASAILPFAITLAMFPRLVELSKQDTPEFFRRSKSVAFTLVGLGLALSLVALAIPAWLLPAIFGSGYAGTTALLQLAAFALPFLFLRQLVTKMFICLERGWALALIEFSALALAIGLNVMLIPIYGSKASATAVVAVYALSALASAFVLWFVQPRSTGEANA